MAYKQLRTGGGNYLKWDVPKTVEGIIAGYEAGEYQGKPTLHVILTQDNGVQVSCPVHKTISSVNSIEAPVGSRLKLVFKSKEVGKSGTKYNNIEAFLDVPGYVGDDDGVTQSVPTQAAPAAVAPAAAVSAPVASATATTASSYEDDLAKLQLLNPAMAKQLPVVFPDLTVRAQKLKDVLAQLGA